MIQLGSSLKIEPNVSENWFARLSLSLGLSKDSKWLVAIYTGIAESGLD